MKIIDGKYQFDSEEELLSSAFKDALEEDLAKLEKDENVSVKTSRRFKIRMNRLFREHVGGTYIPHPEVDNIFERIRSKIVVKFKLEK